MKTDNKKLKVLLLLNGINQRALSRASKIGVTSLHLLINKGEASEKTIEAVTNSLRDDFGVKFTDDDVDSWIVKKLRR